MTESIIKADIPDLDQWEEMEIVEDIGTPDEHADTFYRWENFGIEVHDDGLCQAYVIVDTEEGELPIMVVSGLPSPEAVIEYFRAQHGKEVTGDGGQAAEEPVPEEGETAPIPNGAPGDEPMEKAEPEEKDEKSKDDSKKKSKGKNKGDDVEEKDKKEDKEVKKSAVEKCGDIASASPIKENDDEGERKKSPDAASARAAPMPEPNRSEGTKKEGPIVKSIRDMLADNEAAKTRGLPNGHVTRSAMTLNRTNIAKSSGYQGRMGQGTQIGAGRDAVGTMSGKTPQMNVRNADGASTKQVPGAAKPRMAKGEIPSFADMMKQKAIAKFGGKVEDGLPYSMDGEGPYTGGMPENLDVGSDEEVTDYPAEGETALPVEGEGLGDETGAESGDPVEALSELPPEVLSALASMSPEELSSTVSQAAAAAGVGAEGADTAPVEDVGEEGESSATGEGLDQVPSGGVGSEDPLENIAEKPEEARDLYGDRKFGTPVV